MAGYTLPNTAFGTPNFGIPSGTTNTTDQAIAAIAANLTALNNFEGAITTIPAGPSGTTTIAAGAAAGAAAQGVTATIQGNDLAGTFTVTGATGGNTGAYAAVQFGGRNATPSGVVIAPQSAAAALAGSPTVVVGATGFAVQLNSKGATGGLVYSYLVVG